MVPVTLDPGHVVDDDPLSDRAPKPTPVFVQGRGAPVLADESLLEILEDLGAGLAEGAAMADVVAEVEPSGMDRNAVNRRIRALRKAGTLRDASPRARGRIHLIGAPDRLDGLVT